MHETAIAHREILKPVAVLIAWSLVMLFWSLAVRFPAMKAAGIDVTKLTGTKGSDADRVLPANAQWKIHNYNHLMEQPTLFYAVALTIAFAGTGNGINAMVAWAYVGLRVVHSLVQATSNKVAVRLAFFALSTAALVILTVHALVAVFA